MLKFNVKDEQFINGSEMEVDDGKNFENNKKLNMLSGEIMSNEQNGDGYMDFIISDNSTEYWQSNNRNDIENEIVVLSTQLYEMNQKYKERANSRKKQINKRT
ncbi:hypothetical protein C1645_829335 [Glomus cerebriforme]|uniref:Uncharacterized protein n=1 Tax=Glomus cerebriforme TaxID=658196 RepID=A0A397SJU9_9GLOM|nr:hypothetical protein C1645_829335 [Glomus cerebriforme]